MKKRTKMAAVFLTALLMLAEPVTIPYFPVITVEAAAKASINQKTLALTIGQSKQLKIKNTKSTVKWTSKNKKTAVVTSTGIVRGVSSGKTTITGTAGKKKFTCTVTVYTRQQVLGEYVKKGSCPITISATEKKVCVKMRSILKEITDNSMTPVEKVKAVHDYIVLHTQYDQDNYEKHTIPNRSYHPEGVILYGTAVCQGYAETFDIFMYALGIKSQMEFGYAGSSSHAWNLVKLNGNWYQVDTTWDDPVMNPPISDFIQYKYFLIPDADMAVDHSWDKKSYPVCSGGSYNYYGYKGNILTSTNQFSDYFWSKYNAGERTITVLYPASQTLDTGFLSSSFSYYYAEDRVGPYRLFTVYLDYAKKYN